MVQGRTAQNRAEQSRAVALDPAFDGMLASQLASITWPRNCLPLPLFSTVTSPPFPAAVAFILFRFVF